MAKNNNNPFADVDIRKLKQHVTPLGVSTLTFLNKPSYEFDEKGCYSVKMKFDMLNKKLTAGQNVQTDDGELVGIDQDSGLGVVKNGDDVSVVDPEGLSVDDDDDLSWLDDAIASMDRR